MLLSTSLTHLISLSILFESTLAMPTDKNKYPNTKFDIKGSIPLSGLVKHVVHSASNDVSITMSESNRASHTNSQTWINLGLAAGIVALGTHSFASSRNDKIRFAKLHQKTVDLEASAAAG